MYLLHEGTVDLDPGKWEAFEQAERCIAGSEIVEGNPHAVVPQALKRFHGPLVTLEHDVFGDLKLERLRRQAMPLQGRDDL
ncbi:hypothetical protein D3C72_1881250 [compost metagenome]